MEGWRDEMRGFRGSRRRTETEGLVVQVCVWVWLGAQATVCVSLGLCGVVTLRRDEQPEKSGSSGIKEHFIYMASLKKALCKTHIMKGIEDLDLLGR